MICRLLYLFVSMVGGEYLYGDKYQKQPSDEDVHRPDTFGEFRQTVILFFAWHYQLTILIQVGQWSWPFSANLSIKFSWKVLGGSINYHLQDPWDQKKERRVEYEKHNNCITFWVFQFVHKVVFCVNHQPEGEESVNQVQCVRYLAQK